MEERNGTSWGWAGYEGERSKKTRGEMAQINEGLKKARTRRGAFLFKGNRRKRKGKWFLSLRTHGKVQCTKTRGKNGPHGGERKRELISPVETKG